MGYDRAARTVRPAASHTTTHPSSLPMVAMRAADGHTDAAMIFPACPPVSRHVTSADMGPTSVDAPSSSASARTACSTSHSPMQRSLAVPSGRSRPIGCSGKDAIVTAEGEGEGDGDCLRGGTPVTRQSTSVPGEGDNRSTGVDRLSPVSRNGLWTTTRRAMRNQRSAAAAAATSPPPWSVNFLARVILSGM